MRLGEALRATLLALLALGLVSCLLPVRSGPAVVGRVLDRETGEPVSGALVVVRWDGRYGDDLPDREILGHAETTTDADGRFELPSYSSSGLTVWPLFRTEARVVGVLHRGYACPHPSQVGRAGNVTIRLTPAVVEAERRESCRPVRARRGEADGYLAAWRELFPAAETAQQRQDREQEKRLLDARATLGFGENCEGPVHDLALSPDGRRAAFLTVGRGGAEVRVAELRPEGPGLPVLAEQVDDSDAGRLAWTAPGELVLWQPSSKADRAVSSSMFAAGSAEVVWTDDRTLPASLDRGSQGSSPGIGPRRPLEPADLRDEADTRWQGRSFTLIRGLDPVTGLPKDSVRVTRLDGERYTVELPGEPCAGPRFGQPHYRIDATGRAGLDLRFVDGACHAVRIDLEDGSWQQVDRSDTPGVCQGSRRMPPAQLASALRGWTRDLRAALTEAGADPDATFALEIDEEGRTRALARSFAGEALTLNGPQFPIETPLHRIDVTSVARATRKSRAPKPPPEDLLEPL